MGDVTTIEFAHPKAPGPKYKFGDRVAVCNDSQPQDWAVGKVIGLTLEEIFEPRWWYAVKLDKPLGYTEEYLTGELVQETQILTLQAKWEKGEAAWTQAN